MCPLRCSISKFAFSIFIVALHMTISVNARRCFVCSKSSNVDNQEFHKIFGSKISPKIPKCADYEKADRAEFVRECPPEYNGCLTRFSTVGNIRTCAITSKDECRTDSNSGDTMCFCKKDLCNTPDRKLSDPGFASHKREEAVARALSSRPSSSITFEDDDDFEINTEGSGDEDDNDDYYVDYTEEEDDDAEETRGEMKKFDEEEDDMIDPESGTDTTAPPFISEVFSSTTPPPKNMKKVPNTNNNEFTFEDTNDKQSNLDSNVAFRTPETTNRHSHINQSSRMQTFSAQQLFLFQFILIVKAFKWEAIL